MGELNILVWRLAGVLSIVFPLLFQQALISSDPTASKF